MTKIRLLTLVLAALSGTAMAEVAQARHFSRAMMLIIPAAEKNDSSWGFPNRRKYDSLHIEAVRGEFASDGQGDRDHLF
jgi:hypothetical protein